MEKREGFFGRFFGISQSGSNMRTEILRVSPRLSQLHISLF